MSALSSTVGRLINRTVSDGTWFIWLAIAFCLVLQLHLQFVQKINWDEFYFLSLIYEHKRGELAKPLQTLHVHLFGWLTLVGKDEIQKIEIARFFMWIFEIGTLILIFRTSRLFCSQRASLLGVLCFICSGYVLVHGTSFRADPMAAFFSMLCIYLLAGSKLSYKSILLMGVAAAIAIHITVKVVLFAPLFLWLGFWQLSKFKSPLEVVGRLSTAAMICFVVGFIIYNYQLKIMPAAAPSYSASLVSSAPATLFFESGFFPRWAFIKESVLLSIPQFLLLLVGIGMCIFQIVNSRLLRANSLVLLGMLIPLISFLFYRNAYPYYFPFIFPPAICMVAYGASLMQNKPGIVIFLVLVLVGNFLINFDKRLDEDQSSQQDVITLLQNAFPDGVNYIDRCSMFSSSKKYGYFMSSMGHSNYLKRAHAMFQKHSLKEAVPVVIANSPILKHALESGTETESFFGSLLFSDVEFLNNNYIQHWGAVWVAGVEVSVADYESTFDIAIPGTYTVESKYPVTIDEKLYEDGDTVVLDRGVNSIASVQGQEIVLRWGDNLYMPSHAPSKKRIFTNF